MTVEAMHIILMYQPMLKRKIADAYILAGRWRIRYIDYGSLNYYDLSCEVKNEQR